MMKSLKQYLVEVEQTKESEKMALFEHETYKRIPGTASSYRQDPSNTNTKTEKHAHVYARLNGTGKELYSVNLSGRGHDGSSGTKIPDTHADFLRSIGFDIKPNNILESINWEKLVPNQSKIIQLEG
jgi:hypothetical protein